MAPVVAAILAHHDPPGLEWFIRNVRTFAPDVEVVMYNGARDDEWYRGVDIEVCPYSAPIRYARAHRFHYGVMRWLAETGRDVRFLITTEPDMALVKPGFVERYEITMSRYNADYLGAHYWVSKPGYYQIGLSTKRWKTHYQPIFGTEDPSWVLSAGQVFTPTCIERILSFPHLERLLEMCDDTGIWCPEEMLYPTLAAAVGCNPFESPATPSTSVYRHPPSALREFVEHPWIHWVHKVGTSPSDYDRIAISMLMDHGSVDWDEVEHHYTPPGPLARLGRRGLMSKWYQFWGRFKTV